MPRRGPAGALSRACAVLKVILGETHAKRRVLERTTPIATRPVNGGARPIDRQWSWAGRQVTGVDDDVVTTRIREHQRRDGCPVTEVVREESDLEMANRYMVFQDAASDGASMDGIPRDANDRRWLAGPAPALPSTGATTIAKQPKHTVRWAKEPIRTSEYAQLVAQGKILEQEVSSRRPG